MPKNIITCRFCQKTLKDTFVDLGMSPVSNDYVKPEREQAMEPFYPLHVFVCSNCFLVQLPEHRKEHEIFTDEYAYFSSYSTSWLQHAKEYVQLMMKKYRFTKKSLVVELASNDGYLLQYFREQNVPVLGIEPTANTAEVAIKKGIPTAIEFFGVDTAKKLSKKGKQADLIIGNNVLAHVPDLNDFVEGMRILLKPDGVITIEFPHLLQLMKKKQFDTIYHEHYSYFSFLSVDKIFAAHKLKIFDVEEIPTHGGSLRIYASNLGAEHKLSKNIKLLISTEKKDRLHDLTSYESFAEQVKKTKRTLLSALISLKNDKKTIVGYGAPAKGNTLLNYCGIRQDFLEYTVDKSPHKQNLFLPGTHIPIYSPAKIKETKPDYVLILPWNIQEEIISQLSYIRDWGGKFIVPIPEVKIL